MKLLLKFNANPRLESANGKIPIFKAIKRSSVTLQLFLEYDDLRTQTINTLNSKNLSPLCKVCYQEESSENRAKIELLLKYEATCALALPDYHPIYLALEKKNFTALRLLFRECPDAIHSL